MGLVLSRRLACKHVFPGRWGQMEQDSDSGGASASNSRSTVRRRMIGAGLLTALLTVLAHVLAFSTSLIVLLALQPGSRPNGVRTVLLVFMAYYPFAFMIAGAVLAWMFVKPGRKGSIGLLIVSQVPVGVFVGVTATLLVPKAALPAVLVIPPVIACVWSAILARNIVTADTRSLADHLDAFLVASARQQSDRA